MTLGEKLHKVRMDNGLTQVDFASLFGVTDKAVSTWETGRAFPRFSILQKISKYFHLSIAYLLGEEIIALYDEFDEDKCLEINEKNFCVSKEATPMGSGEEVSMGDAYSVEGLDEKNLLLVLWLSNLEMNQNTMDIGNFNVTVTIQAGNGGEIKGTIAGAVQLDSGSTTDSSTQDDPDLENNQTP